MIAARLMSAGGSFLIPTLFLHFVGTLLKKKARLRLIPFSYALSAIFAALAFTRYLVADVAPKLYLNNLFIPGPIYPLAVLFFLSCITYGHVELYKSYINSFGQTRNQLAFLFWSSAFGYVGGSANFLLVFDINVPFLNPFGTYAIPLYVAATTYAIVRYRLMDITVVINKGLAYSLLLGLIFAPISLAIVISQRITFYSIPPLLAGSLVAACGLWVTLKKPRAVANVTFGLISLAICIWLIGMFMVYSSRSQEESLFWQKVVYVGVAYIPAFFYHFCVSFLGRPTCKLIVPNYLVGTLFLLLIPTPYLINGQYSYFWGYYPKAGALHPLFVVFFVSASLLSLRKLYLGYKESIDAVERTRIKYVFLAFMIGYIASFDFIQSYGIEFYPLGYIFVSVWAIIVTYAIVRYQLLDISLIFTKTKILPYAEALSLSALAYFVILMLVRAFTGSMHYLLAGILLAISTVFAGLIATFQKRVEGMIGEALFRERYNAYKTLTEFSRAMVSILDLPTLIQMILTTLQKVLGIQKISLFLLDKEKDRYVVASSNGLDTEAFKTLRLPAEEGLPYYLRCSKSILVRGELEHPANPTVNRVILHTLQLMESEVCLPLVNKDRLIGFINLGERKNKQMYSEEDLNLLTTLAQNAAIALDNAILYADLKRSQILVRRTDRLRSLETIAGGFAHEIRNPLTSIKTFIQLAPSRKNDAEFIDQFSQVVIEDVHRIERLINEILDYARYMEPKFTEEDLNEVVTSCLYFFEVKATGKSILLEKELDPTLPLVMLDRQQMKQVLLNLFLNAMDAMADRPGRLTVKTHRLTKPSGETWVQIEVADTGSGISPSNLEHIFDPFYTTKHESGEREGTGLGLTIVHQIIQEHHGYIEVESTLGRGTTFYVNLRINPLDIGAPKEHKEHEKTGFIGR